jgi:ubiquinone biosynthesis protein UbiJ
MIKSVLLYSLERAINTFVCLDASAQKKQRALADKIICLKLSDIDQHFFMYFTADKIYLQSECMKKPDLSVSGSCAAFIKMAVNKHQATVPMDMEISGNAHLAQEFQHFLTHINIDWEEHLSHFTGDTVATNTGKFVRNFRGFARKTFHSLAINSKEFLEEEKKIIASKRDVADFCSQVDDLRHQVARLEIQVRKINKGSL